MRGENQWKIENQVIEEEETDARVCPILA